MKHKEAKKNKKKIKKKMVKHQQQMLRISEVIAIKREELLNYCPHKKTKTVNSHIEGSYYDKTQYIQTIVCKLCGKELDKTITTGSYA